MPDISQGSGPLYLRLAERIESDISEGVLPAGAKLPPQRNLAFDIGVTIGTVGRAYALVQERGLVSGEVGRGTYVRGRDPVPTVAAVAEPEILGGTRTAAPSRGKIRMDSTAAPDVGQGMMVERLVGQIVRDNPEKVIDYTRDWPSAWREAGSRWMAADGWTPDVQSIVPTLGVHAAVMAVVAAVTVPGDRIAFEQLTYASLSRSANLVGRRSVMVGSDEDGADPEDFERLCAQQHPKAAFLIPSLQNPTLAVMPNARRRAIAEIARRYNVWLIEDAIYGTLLEDQPTPLAALAPERTFLVGGLSKAVAAGVRAGYVACPPHFAPRVQTAHKMVTGGMPFMLAELAAEIVLSGEADAIRARVRREIAARQALAVHHFAGLDFKSHPVAPFLWMKLPEPWLSGTFKHTAASEGVLVDDEDEYKPGRTDQVFHRVRIGFSQPETRDEVARGFATIRRLLDNGGAGYDSYG